MRSLFALLASTATKLALVLTPGAAVAATLTASVNATPVKPLTLTKVQDLDFGSVALGPGVWSNARISLSQTGTFTCANANLVCTGATTVARYNVQGSNQQPVIVSAPNVTLVNQANPSKTLTLVTDAPVSIVIPNAGSRGVDFSVGGSVTLASTTPAGTYVGTFNVTVNY